ncbi:metallophosphoesterase [Lewinella sp. 4G2]|uniref:metallophosphoesterase n=1 Tax=Lewinella sp. 4G2 TaxID=1803372 RepID=UPI0007B4BDE2|nr:metallophosphoesterase [Lewinella sp. 4G2]OAV44096.1 hypothetical protein A3850_006100 [Lewinella sp. 4G2]
MKKLKISLAVMAGLCILFLLFGLYQVRYNGTYGRFDGSLRYLKYDEANDRFIFFGFLDYQLDGIDGPIVKRLGADSLEMAYVVGEASEKYTVVKSVLPLRDSLQFTVKVDNTDKDKFTVTLRGTPESRPVVYGPQPKLLALSDMEGNFNALYGLLTANGVMTEDYRWNFGNGHVVCNGDFVDRGRNVLACLWLLYELQGQAEQAGGKLHFINGNHEHWNLTAYPKSAHSRLIAFAQAATGIEQPVPAFAELMNDENILVAWLKKQPVMLQIGNKLFVHAGISPEFAKAGWDIEKVNQVFWNSIDGGVENAETELLYDDKLGPLWSRTMVRPYGGKEKLSDAEYASILKTYGVNHLIIGHSIVEEVSTDYNGSLFRIDVQHAEEKFSAQTQGLLFEEGKAFRVNALGERVVLSRVVG